MAHKEISKGHEARLKIKAGVDKACDAVRPTLGPIGMTAVIEFLGLDPIECDDGVTILKNIEFKDHYENMGVQMLRKGALRTSTEGGDGTATTTVITQALVNEAFKEIANDSSKIREVRERLTTGLATTLSELGSLKRDVNESDIERIANISSLDSEVAKLIAEVIKDVGVNGVITVEKGSKIGYSKEVVKGAKFDRGFISPYFLNDMEAQEAVLENPFIAIIDRKVSTNEQVASIMKSVQESGNKSILFIADDVDSLALATLIQNSKTVNVVDATGKIKSGTFDIACVRNPFNGTRGRQFLEDMAALTGATVISEQAGMKLDVATIAQCGQAQKVVITKDTTTIIGGKSGDAIQSRIKAIETEIDGSVSDYEKIQLQDRLASLTGGIGVIRVGAYTDTEFNAKKYKFQNAINATQAALQEGILPGGGSALAKVQISDPMFKEAFLAPFKQMSVNAGLEWHKFINNIQDPNNENGVDFINKKSVNMFEAGIIDPFKVTRIALESAVAITTALIGMETAIVVEDKLDVKN